MTRIAYLTLVVLLTALPARAQGNANETATSVLVTTIQPSQGQLAQPLTAYGTVQPAPGGTINISSLHAAQVSKLHVVPGQAVSAGAPLVELAADPAAALAFAQAQSDLKLAQGELMRTRQMLAERLATNSQVDQAEKVAKDAEATLQARIREGGTVATTTLTAPAAGTVTAITAANGDHIQPGASILTLATATGALGVIGIPPKSLSLVKSGQPAQLIDLDSSAEPISGSVRSVGQVADPKTGLMTVVVDVASQVAKPLTVGAHLRATITTMPVTGWIVPRESILTDDEGTFAFQVADGKAVRVPVTVLAGAGDQLTVSGAFDAKRKLVVGGAYQLGDGMAVREPQGEKQAASASK